MPIHVCRFERTRKDVKYVNDPFQLSYNITRLLYAAYCMLTALIDHIRYRKSYEGGMEIVSNRWYQMGGFFMLCDAGSIRMNHMCSTDITTKNRCLPIA